MSAADFQNGYNWAVVSLNIHNGDKRSEQAAERVLDAVFAHAADDARLRAIITDAWFESED